MLVSINQDNRMLYRWEQSYMQVSQELSNHRQVDFWRHLVLPLSKVQARPRRLMRAEAVAEILAATHL
jgi:hypothetical protein